MSLKRPDCGRFGTNLKSSGVGISTFPSPGRTTKDVVYSWSPYQGFSRDDGTYTIAGVSMQDIVSKHTINYGTGCYPFPTQLGRRTDGNKAETVPLPNMCVSMHAAQEYKTCFIYSCAARPLHAARTTRTTISLSCSRVGVLRFRFFFKCNDYIQLLLYITNDKWTSYAKTIFIYHTRHTFLRTDSPTAKWPRIQLSKKLSWTSTCHPCSKICKSRLATAPHISIAPTPTPPSPSSSK